MFWMLSVWPPEQAEKSVSAILPPYMTTSALAAGRGRRGVAARVLAFQALVDLAAGVGVEVEAVAADAGGEREGARGNRLRLQLLGRPGGRRLVRDHAFDVLVDGERVDDVERAGGAFGRHRLEGAAVGAGPGDRDLALAGGAQFRAAVGEPLGAGAAQHDRVAGAVGLVVAGRVEGLAAGAGGGAEADIAGGDVEQDPDHMGAGERPQGGAGEVVAEDELVALAVQGVAVGAVGAHADAVAEAVAVDDPADAGVGGGGRDRDQARQRRQEGGEAGDPGGSSGTAHASPTASPPGSRGLSPRRDWANRFSLKGGLADLFRNYAVLITHRTV